MLGEIEGLSTWTPSSVTQTLDHLFEHIHISKERSFWVWLFLKVFSNLTLAT